MKANISEIFYSIQGEGLTIGYPAIFIRFCGCNLNCSFCDTKYAINCERWLKYEDIQKEVKRFEAKRVIFTGGEPALQDKFMAYFIKNNQGYLYQVETNGTIFPEESISLLDHITVSPKMFAVNSEVLKTIKAEAKSVEFKFVVDENFEEELELAKELDLSPVVLQPIWRNETLKDYLEKVKNIIEIAKEKAPYVRVIPQLHKILYGQKRGV